MRIVEVGGVLRSDMRIHRIGHAVRRIRADNRITPIIAWNDMLVDAHIRHIEDETERIDRIDIPIVTYLQHVVLKTGVVMRIGVVLERRRLAGCLEVHIILRIDLRQLGKGIGFFAAIVKIQRCVLGIQPSVHIAKIHTSVGGREHTIKTTHHIALGLDIDDTALTGRIVFGGRIGDNLYLLDRVAVCTVEHGFQLLAAEVRRFTVYPNLDGLTVHGDIAVLIDTHTGRTAKDIISVRTRGKRRRTHVHHELVHLAFDQRLLGFHL